MVVKPKGSVPPQNVQLKSFSFWKWFWKMLSPEYWLHLLIYLFVENGKKRPTSIFSLCGFYVFFRLEKVGWLILMLVDLKWFEAYTSIRFDAKGACVTLVFLERDPTAIYIYISTYISLLVYYVQPFLPSQRKQENRLTSTINPKRWTMFNGFFWGVSSFETPVYDKIDSKICIVYQVFLFRMCLVSQKKAQTHS